MNMSMPDRHRGAFLIATLCAAGSWYLFMLTQIWVANGHLPWNTDVLAFFTGTVIIGLPITAIVTVIFGIPAYKILLAKNALRFVPIVVIGAAAGFITALAFSWITQDWEILPPLVGAVIGFISALVWWLKAGRPGLMRKAETQ
jgi:hypothetical protein